MISKTQEIIISDTSCLILLHKIGRLELLKQLFGSVVITPAIADEFRKALPVWMSVRQPENLSVLNRLREKVDEGEASAIALAIETGAALLIIDEQKGRNLARISGIKITGTLGVLLLAKQQGFIHGIRELLFEISKTDFRLSEQLVERTLKLAGE